MNYRFRVNEEGALILQVEVYDDSPDYAYSRMKPKWRDAKVEDIPILDALRTEAIPTTRAFQA